MKDFIGLLALLSVGVVHGQTVFLNIPSHHQPKTGEYVPTMSLPTSGWDACADAMVAYAKDNYVRYIGCDVKPFKGAVNLKSIRRI